MINEENQKRLANAMLDTKEATSFVLKDGMNRHISIIERYNNYIKEISVLSLAILGVVLPLIYQNNSSYFIKLAIIFFFINALLGFLYVLHVLRNSIINIPRVVDKQTNKGIKIIKRIEEISNIQDNHEAGIAWKDFLADSQKELSVKVENNKGFKFKIIRFLNIEVLFFSFFFCGLVALFLGIFFKL